MSSNRVMLISTQGPSPRHWFRHAQFCRPLRAIPSAGKAKMSTTEVENMVSEYDKITEAVVYGVEIPNTNGRAGMAAITLADGW